MNISCAVADVRTMLQSLQRHKSLLDCLSVILFALSVYYVDIVDCL